jgi:hypothetical protein
MVISPPVRAAGLLVAGEVEGVLIYGAQGLEVLRPLPGPPGRPTCEGAAAGLSPGLGAAAPPKPSKLSRDRMLREAVQGMLDRRYSPGQANGRLQVDYPAPQAVRLAHPPRGTR